MNRITAPLKRLWRAGCAGKLAVCAILLVLLSCPCVLVSTLSPTETPTPLPPTSAPVASGPTAAASPVATDTPHPTEVVPPTATRTRLPKPTPTATLGLQARLCTAVTKALSSGNRQSVQRLSSCSLSGNSVTIQWAINDSLTEGMTKSSANLDIINMLRTIYTGDFGVEKAVLDGTYSMVDKFGQVTEDRVIHYEMGASTAGKVNWENVNFHDMYDIADKVSVHPTFRW